MKVKELIKELKKLDPEEEITIYHSDSGTYDTIHEVIPANSDGLGDDEHGQYPASICP